MQCPVCDHENSEDATFCGHCGARLDETEEDQSLLDLVRRYLNERYEVRGEIGRGGMAVVFRALDRDLGREVALKVLPLTHSHSQDLVRRFKREARLAASLHHPNIVPIYDVGSSGPIHYFTMTFLKGSTLDQLMRDGMTLSRAIGVVRQVASALDYAHGHGLIHRDIKPANILFDEHGSAVVADFGIAKGGAQQTQAHETTSSFFGTPHYMSPEQVTDDPVDGRADLYALGVIFYQMLVGRTPFQGSEALSVMYQHVNDKPEDPTEIEPSMPIALSRIVLKLLSKKREDRFESGRALLAEIEALPAEILGHIELLTPSPPFGSQTTQTLLLSETAKSQWFMRMRRWRSHTRELILAGAAIVLLMVVAFSFMFSGSSTEEPVLDRGFTVLEPTLNQPDSMLEFPDSSNASSEEVTVLDETEPEVAVETPVLDEAPEATDVAIQPVETLLSDEEKQKTAVREALLLMGMVKVEGGTFSMGSNYGLNFNERPIHEVRVDDFQLGRVEVTQALWTAVTGFNPSCEPIDDGPVTNVSYADIISFLSKLNGILGTTYRLPTEAEWEYACQSGETEGEDFENLVWHGRNSGETVHRVATLGTDALGFHDLRGNVWEWVSDYYDRNYYKESPVDNPTGPLSGDEHVYRGGGWDTRPNQCRCANREAAEKDYNNCALGFRLAHD